METPSFGWSLCQLFRAWQSGMTEAVTDLPHHARGYQILEALSTGAEPTQSELATHLGIDRTVLTYVLDDLVGASLLERRADPDDRRVRRLTITATGSSSFARAFDRVSKAEQLLLAGISSAEQSSLRKLLLRTASTIAGGELVLRTCIQENDPPDLSGSAA